jgi:hypothetical protein
VKFSTERRKKRIHFMEGKADSDLITDEWLVDEVLQRYPSTAAVFLQYRPICRTEPDRLFPHYPVMDLREYAESKGLRLELLLRQLHAAAEHGELVRRNPWIVSKSRNIEVSPGIYTRPEDF